MKITFGPFKGALTAMTLLSLPTIAVSQGGNECVDAMPLTPGVPAPYDTWQGGASSASVPPFSCALNPSIAASFPDVWFKFVAPADYMARVSNCETAISLSRIEVYTGSCGALVSLNCSTNTCWSDPGSIFNPQTQYYGTTVDFMATAGEEYYVRVGGESPFMALDNGTIVVEPPQSPGNDDCTNATSVVGGTTPFSNEFAGDGGLTMCAEGGSTSDVWFRYIATQDGTLAIDTFGSAFDTVLAVYDGGCATPNLIACNDDAGGLQSEVVIGVVEGTEYQIQVGGFGGATGVGVLNVEQQSSTGIADLVCLGSLNSTGFVGLISAQGSLFAADNDLTLGISGCPVNVLGMVVTTNSNASSIVTIPNLGGGMGSLCIANLQLARFPLISTDASGTATVMVDTAAIPANPTATMAAPGDTHYFQFWHRDVFNGSATSNLSSAISVTFE